MEEHYIGSDEDDPADTGGACLSSAAAFEPSFDCGEDGFSVRAPKEGFVMCIGMMKCRWS